PSRRGLHTLPGFPGRRTHGRGAADLGRSGRPHRTGAPGNPHRHPHRNGRGTVPTRRHPPTPQQPITAITTLQGGLVPTPKRTARAAIALASTLLLSACGSQPAATEEQEAPTDGYPVTVQNCGAEVTFDAAPEQLVLFKSASVPALHELGVLDRAVARAGAFPEEYFDDATLAELDNIPQLTSNVDATGHLQISKEVVVAEQPDLVFGEIENLPRQSLSQAGISLLEEPAL